MGKRGSICKDMKSRLAWPKYSIQFRSEVDQCIVPDFDIESDFTRPVKEYFQENLMLILLQSASLCGFQNLPLCSSRRNG